MNDDSDTETITGLSTPEHTNASVLSVDQGSYNFTIEQETH
jgi:hypothetical protein